MRIGVFFLAILLWSVAVPVQAQETTPSNSQTQTVCKVGVYLADLYDIDTRARRFGADIWAWSVCNNGKNALKAADWINAQDQVQSLEFNSATDFGLWSNQKITGHYRQPFDIRNYPFDRHTLRIVVEDSIDEASTLKYVADDRGSRVSPNLQVEGWDIKRFVVQTREEAFGTAFGDPARPDAQQTLYPHLEIVIDIERSDVWTFLKLVGPVYIASILTLLSFLMDDKDNEYLTPRLGVLGGVLFAIVLNMRSVQEMLGETNGLSLMDKTHLLSLALAVPATAAATAWTFLIRNGWDAARVLKSDRRFFFVGTGL
ncbi:hypothetical protein [Sphingorhabdus sp. EL138]|uniref:hypothetical protein n=1 Tax=Sphingorhabdus sp. EL138 TaxID=2073156 RepID=UPI0025F066A8|nr:hypothetical protein [Sphingorhabdus sp. EL138]